MENLIQLESERLKANQDDLIKLQKLADAAEQTTIDSVDLTLQGLFLYIFLALYQEVLIVSHFCLSL